MEASAHTPTVTLRGVPPARFATPGASVTAGTPREVVLRMNAAINKVLLMPAVRARMTDVGYVVTGGSPEDFGRVIKTEMEKWSKVLHDANIKAE